ncbi:hypothetical protein M3Y94_00100200 [Aphelenchoides besseyi]|nr:hypothetical protein M3Y94_00100200 [Aphelenchoides besseyi]
MFKLVLNGRLKLRLRFQVAIIILCAQAFVLTMLYLSNYSIIISQGRTSDFQLTNFDTKKVMSDLIKNVKSVDEHLDKSKQANPEPDSGSKHEDGRVDEETAQKEAPNLWLRDPEEHYRVPKEKITFSDELNADIYSVDYSLSHPMDNECRFPILIKGNKLHLTVLFSCSDEPDLLPAVEHYVEADCPPSKKPILVEQLHTGEILVGRRFMSKASKNFTCYAQELSGALRPKNIQLNFVGDFIKLPFNKRIYVEKDQFHVQCKDPNGKIVFEDAFTNVPYKERLHPPQLDGTLNFSVALLILDSNSRNQFVRHAPQVADNSAVNLLPLLAGKTFDLKKHGIEHLIRPDMHLTPEMIKDDVWKHANMLTKLMKERGCATLWNDDEKMFNELSKYVDYKTKRLECVETARIEPPKTYTPYTINAMARLGIRTPDMWEKRIKEGKHYNSTENEIFDVEFDVPLQIQTNGGETSARRFALRSRMIFHRETKYVRLIAKPLLLDPEKKCINVFVIDDMCKFHLDDSKEVNVSIDPRLHIDGRTDNSVDQWKPVDYVAVRQKSTDRVPRTPVTFSDDLDADLYDIDYSLSHPFDNHCRFPVQIKVANDAFTNIPYKKRLYPPSLDKTSNFSVSILVLDSTSRNQFYRHAPMTLKFLRENGFLVLNGYNKVNDNSAVNLTPLLAGKSFDVKFYGNRNLLRKDMIIGEKNVKYDFWESANSLVRRMKLRGCATMWNDDIMHPILGLYNYGPIKGFKSLLHVLVQKERYGQDLREWRSRSISLLEKLGKSPIQKTYSGRIEERMPFFSIYFPRKFHENYPEKVEQYRTNLNRLVSNYDIYETLREILNFQDSDRQPVGISLFNKIPRNRTCTDARVVYHHCTCLQRVDADLVPEEIKVRSSIECVVIFQEQVMIDFETYVNSTRPVITCVRKIDMTTPVLFQPFTINALARNGIRSASDLKKKSKQVKSTYKAMNHEIFDIEFDVPIRLETLRKSDSDRKRELVDTSLILRTRALYNRETNYTRLVAKPMIRKAPEKCKGIYILENICNCLEN